MTRYIGIIIGIGFTTGTYCMFILEYKGISRVGITHLVDKVDKNLGGWGGGDCTTATPRIKGHGPQRYRGGLEM